MLEENWAEISRQNRLSRHSPISPGGAVDPNQSKAFVRELERLAVTATTSAEQQKLRSIANFIKQFDLVHTQKRINAIDALIWKALFAEESIAKYASQCGQLRQELEMSENLKTQTIPETEVESLNKNISRLTQQVVDCDATMDYLVQSYINTIKNSQQFNKGAIDRQLNQISAGPNLGGNLQSSLNAKLKVFQDHILLYNTSPENIQHKTIIKDILTAIAN